MTGDSVIVSAMAVWLARLWALYAASQGLSPAGAPENLSVNC
jgi:hypothetical protein